MFKEKSNKIKKIANNVTELAKKKNQIKSLGDAFKSNPVSIEIHKGRKEYFSN